MKWTPGGRREAGSSWTYGARKYGHNRAQQPPLRDGRLGLGFISLCWDEADRGQERSGEDGNQWGGAQAGDRCWTGSRSTSSFCIYWLHRGFALPLSCHHGASHHLTCYFSLLIYVTKRAEFRAVFSQFCLLIHPNT